MLLFGLIFGPLASSNYQETPQPDDSTNLFWLAVEIFNLRFLDSVVLSSKVPNILPGLSYPKQPETTSDNLFQLYLDTRL